MKFVLVERNTQTGTEKVFCDTPWGSSRETCEKAMEVRKLIVTDDHHEWSIRENDSRSTGVMLKTFKHT